jgi:hypothetical protein
MNEKISLPERRFTSQYAPLAPDGPLAPGVSEGIAVNAYRHWGLRAKKVLSMMGIHRGTESAGRRLRGALDKPECREGRNEGPKRTHRPPFYIALYYFLKDEPVGRDIYSRFIKPAEYEENGAPFLEPELEGSEGAWWLTPATRFYLKFKASIQRREAKNLAAGRLEKESGGPAKSRGGVRL